MEHDQLNAAPECVMMRQEMQGKTIYGRKEVQASVDILLAYGLPGVSGGAEKSLNTNEPI
jgi:hypothetical protein